MSLITNHNSDTLNQHTNLHLSVFRKVPYLLENARVYRSKRNNSILHASIKISTFVTFAVRGFATPQLATNARVMFYSNSGSRESRNPTHAAHTHTQRARHHHHGVTHHPSHGAELNKGSMTIRHQRKTTPPPRPWNGRTGVMNVHLFFSSLVPARHVLWRLT